MTPENFGVIPKLFGVQIVPLEILYGFAFHYILLRPVSIIGYSNLTNQYC